MQKGFVENISLKKLLLPLLKSNRNFISVPFSSVRILSKEIKNHKIRLKKFKVKQKLGKMQNYKKGKTNFQSNSCPITFKSHEKI